MCGHTRRDRTKNNVIRDKVGMASMMDKMRETGLRCEEKTHTCPGEEVVRRCERLAIVGIRRSKDKPKKF